MTGGALLERGSLHQSRDTPEGTAAHGGVHASAGTPLRGPHGSRRNEKEGAAERNLHAIIPTCCITATSPKGWSATCGDNRGREGKESCGGEVTGVKLRLRKGEERSSPQVFNCFCSLYLTSHISN